MIALRTSSPFRQALVDLVVALGHTSQERGTVDDLAMLAIDLAEARPTVVLLDDIHNAMPEAIPFLAAVARYTRKAVWLATSRVEPALPELAGQVIRLGSIGERELGALARRVDPQMSKSRAAEIALEAAGSPWRLRRLVGENVSDGASRTVLEALVVMERPMSLQAIEKAAGAKARSALGDLARRGLVEIVAGGYRLHEAARATVNDAVMPGSADLRERTIAALADSDAIEALRLALADDRIDSALAICAKSFDAMMRAGRAPTLWKLIAELDGEAWRSYKLRVAMQLGDVKVTSVLDEPPASALRDRLLWVRALVIEEKIDAAARAADALASEAQSSGDPHLAFWAVVEHAMVSRSHAGPDRGLELLAAAVPVDDATRALIAALSAFWSAEVGRIDDAIRTLARTKKLVVPSGAPLADEILGGPVDFFVRYYRMAAFMECGYLGDAHAELTSGKALVDDLRASYVQRDGIANLAIARGQLGEAKKMLERLLRTAPTGSGSTYHTIARLLEIERRLVAGELAGIAGDLERLMDDTRTRNALVHAWCLDTRERLWITTGISDEPSVDLSAAPLGAVARALFSLRSALRHARWGRAHAAHEALDIEGAIVVEIVAATDALVAGDARQACVVAKRAIDLAKTHGWGVREIEARQLLVEGLIADGDRTRARREVEILARQASAMPSARYVLEARWLAMAAADSILDACLLEELAEADAIAPCAARRSRALLGDEARLDALDERVVAAVRAQAGVEIVRVHAAARRGWGLDLRTQTLWFPNGRRVSLVRHKLLTRVLEVLARSGGSATFEALARDVWSVRTFHPLSDGNRIRVSLHRLRALVEEDPAHPERIVLRETSAYELGAEPFTLVAKT